MRRKGWASVVVGAALAAGLVLGGCATREPEPAADAESPQVVSPAPTEITKLIFAQHGAPQGMELYLYEVIIPVGEEIAAHEHPGLQMAHIMEGSLEYEILEGTVIIIRDAGTDQQTQEEVSDETVVLETGDGVIEDVGMVHQARNPGDVPTRIVLSSLFPRGDELSSPVPMPSPAA